jgi:hypothetical protein
MTMIEDEVLQQFLEKACEDAKKYIKEKGVLTTEYAIPLLLRAHYNHIVHLDKEVTEIKEELRNIRSVMATKEDIKNMATKEDIKNMATKEDIRTIQYWIAFGFTLLGIFLPIIMTFILKFFK